MLDKMVIQWNPGHLIITATFFWPPDKNDNYTFSWKETLVNTVTWLFVSNVFGPIGERISGVPLYMHLETRNCIVRYNMYFEVYIKLNNTNLPCTWEWSNKDGYSALSSVISICLFIRRFLSGNVSIIPVSIFPLSGFLLFHSAPRASLWRSSKLRPLPQGKAVPSLRLHASILKGSLSRAFHQLWPVCARWPQDHPSTVFSHYETFRKAGQTKNPTCK